MYAQSTGEVQPGEGLYTIEAEFYTEHLMLRGSVTSPDRRISDHLNGSLPSVQLRVVHAERILGGAHLDLSGKFASVTKAHLLFVLPVTEPEPLEREQNVAWTWTMTRTAWAGLGRFSVTGKVHTDPGRDDRHLLRSFESQPFLPLTDAVVTAADGGLRRYNIVILNTSHLEVLAV